MPALVAVVATVPVWRESALAYIDNAPHLVELDVLVRQILPVDHWYAGWTDLALAGTPVGLTNAPLAWGALAVVHLLGAPLGFVYRAAIVGSNVAVGVAAWRFVVHKAGGVTAAVLAGSLAAATVPELYGIGGAAGGMWPWRLALALVVWDVGGGPRGVAGRAVLTAMITGTHMFGAICHGAWTLTLVVALLLRGDRPAAMRTAIGAALGWLCMAFYLVPLLDPALRTFDGLTLNPLAPLAVLMAVVTPIDCYWAWSGTAPTWVAGWGSWGAVGLAWVGVLGLLLRGRARLPTSGLPTSGLPTSWLPGAAWALGITVLAAGCAMTGSKLLGPVSWRYFAVAHLALAIAGGVGLARVGPRLGVLLAGVIAVVACWCGSTEIPARTGDVAQLWSDMEAAWDVAEAHRQGGRLYLEDPMQDREAPAALQWTHPGPLHSLTTQTPTLGSWYGIVDSPTFAYTLSEAGFTLGLSGSQLREHPEEPARRLKVFAVGAVVTVTPTLEALLAASPDFVRVSGHGPFVVFASAAAPLPLVNARGIAAGDPVTVGGIEADGPGRIRVDVGAAGPVTVRVRTAWHPWWRVTVDGAPVPSGNTDTYGFLSFELPRGGAVAATWAPPDRVTGPLLSLSGLLVTAAFGLRRRRR